ncbi:hypothetical protein [Gaetbulibacter aestuarii]|uniref:Uncharacterized protein n=1 Tax=Gaetbulibacter aestuarii TaxID=1502358 RepID=A0ABW7MYY7_9FLAO
MKKWILTFILGINLIWTCFSQNNIQLIEKTISELKSNSPGHEGVLVNSYCIRDLDNDGIFEIIETSNRIEAAVMGLLNSEISGAFDYDKVYVLKGKQYVLATSDIGYYLRSKVPHYLLWKRLISDPENLSTDSQHLIKENKDSFLGEIDWILNQIKAKTE